MRISEIEKPGLIRVGAVRRGTTVMVAKPDDALVAGDEISVIVAPEALSEFVNSFAATTQDVPIRLSA